MSNIIIIVIIRWKTYNLSLSTWIMARVYSVKSEMLNHLSLPLNQNSMKDSVFLYIITPSIVLGLADIQ